MELERLTEVVKSVLAIDRSRVDILVEDYRDLKRVSGFLGIEVPFEPEHVVEVARQKGRLTEEEIQEYLSRTKQEDDV